MSLFYFSVLHENEIVYYYISYMVMGFFADVVSLSAHKYSECEWDIKGCKLHPSLS